MSERSVYNEGIVATRSAKACRRKGLRRPPMPSPMIRTYTLRLKPTKRQCLELTDLVEHLCVLYNSALEQRIRNWEDCSISTSYYDQQRALTAFRSKSPEVKRFPAAIQRDPLRRVDRAFKGFFRRISEGAKPGHPRFKSSSQYASFDVDSQNFEITEAGLRIMKLGTFRVKTHYKIVGTPKLICIARRGNRWLCNLVCKIGDRPAKRSITNLVGIDLGIKSLATLSDGSEIANPRWVKREAGRVASANQSLSRKVKGSKNRSKSKERLRRVHQRIAGLRLSYVTEVARNLVKKYDLIAHESLNIKGMAQSNLAKSIMDAAWGKLIWRLNCEAEKAGKWVVPVNPRNTTKACSGCGLIVPKTLAQRTHVCPDCGLTLGRDHNAAINILRLGESLVERQNHG